MGAWCWLFMHVCALCLCVDQKVTKGASVHWEMCEDITVVFWWFFFSPFSALPLIYNTLHCQ